MARKNWAGGSASTLERAVPDAEADSSINVLLRRTLGKKMQAPTAGKGEQRDIQQPSFDYL